MYYYYLLFYKQTRSAQLERKKMPTLASILGQKTLEYLLVTPVILPNLLAQCLAVERKEARGEGRKEESAQQRR